MNVQLVAVLLLAGISTVYGIKCYVCTSATTSGCGDNFSLSPSSSKYIMNNCTTCQKGFVESLITRTCSPARISTGCVEVLGVGTCSCSTDLCNSSGGVFVKPVLLVAALVSVILLNLLRV
ncbi:hypothetical protein ScPMuIL_008897 [Solemya velum]